jgi:hypothetical protein
VTLLTLDQALNKGFNKDPKSAESSRAKAGLLQQSDYAINGIRRSAHKSNKMESGTQKQTRFAPDTKASGKTHAPCRYCGGPKRNSFGECQAYGKICDN